MVYLNVVYTTIPAQRTRFLLEIRSIVRETSLPAIETRQT